MNKKNGLSAKKASVILPTYDEAGNIVKLVEAIQKELAKEKISNEIIIIDDNSPDRTGILARKYFENDPTVKVFIRNKDKGLATAIRYGLEQAQGEVVVVMDTDFNHEPELVPQLVKKCKEYDFVVGSRFVEGGGMVNKNRELLSRLFNIFLVRVIIGSPVHDNLSGFFAMRRRKLLKLNFNRIFYGYGDYFIRLIYLAKRHGNTFAELPSFYRNRSYGTSKSQFIDMFLDYFVSCIKIRLVKA